MAKKGQTFRKYDLAFKQKVLKERKAGYSISYLSNKHGIPEGTIHSWSRSAKRFGGLEVAKKGRPKGTNPMDYKERYEILKKYQDFLDQKEPGKK